MKNATGVCTPIWLRLCCERPGHCMPMIPSEWSWIGGLCAGRDHDRRFVGSVSLGSVSKIARSSEDEYTARPAGISSNFYRYYSRPQQRCGSAGLDAVGARSLLCNGSRLSALRTTLSSASTWCLLRHARGKEHPIPAGPVTSGGSQHRLALGPDHSLDWCHHSFHLSRPAAPRALLRRCHPKTFYLPDQQLSLACAAGGAAVSMPLDH